MLGVLCWVPVQGACAAPQPALAPGEPERAGLQLRAMWSTPLTFSALLFFGEEALTLFLLLREMHLEPNEGSKV